MVFKKGKRKSFADSASKSTPKKTPKSLKVKEKIAKESLPKKPAQAKEGETSSHVKDRKENGEKGTNDGKKVSDQSKRDEKRHNTQSRNENERHIDEKHKTQSGNKNERRIDEKHKTLKKRDQQSTVNNGGKDRKQNVRKEIKDGKKVIGQSQRTEKHPTTQSGSKYERRIDDKHKELKIRDRHSTEKHGGMIFMCSSKTKPDCFRYQVMGITSNKQDVVMRIKPGLKLFLYDFDLKLLYGIYEASSTGGVKLEPKAFGGGFPAQVRFTVIEDCLPLPESVFKKAIKDNYDEKKRKFTTDLSVAQVKQLIKLFRPTPWLHEPSNSSLPESVPESVIRHASAGKVPGERSHLPNHHIVRKDAPSSSLFLTEKEYRSYGLQQGRQLVPTDTAAGVHRQLDHYRPDERREQHYRPDEGREQPLRNQIGQNEAGFSDPYFPGEKEYRTYGLKGYQEVTTVQHPVETDSIMTSTMNLGAQNHASYSCNPYNDSTTSLVNRYLSLPMRMAEPVESYSLPGRESYIPEHNYTRETGGHLGRVIAERETYSLPGRESYINEANYTRETGGHPGRVIAERESQHSPYAATYAPSDHSLRYQYPGNDPDYSSTPVLYRQSYAGHSASRY